MGRFLTVLWKGCRIRSWNVTLVRLWSASPCRSEFACRSEIKFLRKKFGDVTNVWTLCARIVLHVHYLFSSVLKVLFSLADIVGAWYMRNAIWSPHFVPENVQLNHMEYAWKERGPPTIHCTTLVVRNWIEFFLYWIRAILLKWFW